jgi:hypothetical protein
MSGEVWILAALALAAALVAVVAPEAGASAAPPASMASAEECARCHRDIARYWKASLHAQAVDNHRFQDLFQRLKEKRTPNVDALCLQCHAPAALYMRDLGFEKKVSWEGVTCDFCHSVRSVQSQAARPFVLQVGRVKTGPLRTAQPSGHAAEYAEVHTSSTICAPCHQFVNENGLEVLGTAAEWQASSYASRSVTCQSCHMRATSGKVTDPKVARASQAVVNLHEMPGGHSLTELNRALLAQISAVRRGGNTVEVAVQITNRGAGHRVPTGLPLRTIVMVVEVDGGVGPRQTAERTYTRVVADENGQALSDEEAIWLRGAKVVRDNRLAPEERRTEQFSFQVPRNTPVRVVAKFYYRYDPAPARGESTMPFLSVNTWLDAEGRN